MSAAAFSLDSLTGDDAAPLFRDPDRPGRLLALVAAVPGLLGWVLVRPVGDARPAAAFRALLADLRPVTPAP